MRNYNIVIIMLYIAVVAISHNYRCVITLFLMALLYTYMYNYVKNILVKTTVVNLITLYYS